MSKNLRVKDMPRVEQPREKLEKYGVERLSSEELLAIILRTGTKGQNVLDMSYALIKLHGDNLKDLNLDEMSKFHGLGKVKSMQLIACFELGKRFLQNKKSKLIMTPQDVWTEMKDISEMKKEHFVAFFLDSRNQQIKREIISIGTVSASLVHPREVFEPAIRYSASQIIVSHNHPSGMLEPSNADEQITSKLIEAGKILGIELFDHIIVTKESWYSFKLEGLLK